MSLPGAPLRVCLAGRPIDWPTGIDGLAALAREELRLDPFSGMVPVFRAKRADRIKIIVWNGTGMVPVTRRLDAGKCAWPAPNDGVRRLSSAQPSSLFEGLAWRCVHARRVRRPEMTG